MKRYHYLKLLLHKKPNTTSKILLVDTASRIIFCLPVYASLDVHKLHRLRDMPVFATLRFARRSYIYEQQFIPQANIQLVGFFSFKTNQKNKNVSAYTLTSCPTSVQPSYIVITRLSYAPLRGLSVHAPLCSADSPLSKLNGLSLCQTSKQTPQTQIRRRLL